MGKSLTVLLVTVVALMAALPASAAQEQVSEEALAARGQAATVALNPQGNCSGPDNNRIRTIRGYITNLQQEGGGALAKVASIARAYPASWRGKSARLYPRRLRNRAIVARLAAPVTPVRYGCFASSDGRTAVYLDPPNPRLRKGTWVVAKLPGYLAKSNVRARMPDSGSWERRVVTGVYLAHANTSRPATPRFVKIVLWLRMSAVRYNLLEALNWRGERVSVPEGGRLVLSCGRTTTAVLRATPDPRLLGNCPVGTTTQLSKQGLSRWNLIGQDPLVFKVPAGGTVRRITLRQKPPLAAVRLRVTARNGGTAVRVPAGAIRFRITADGNVVRSNVGNAGGGRWKITARVESLQVVRICRIPSAKNSPWRRYSVVGGHCSSHVADPGEHIRRSVRLVRR